MTSSKLIIFTLCALTLCFNAAAQAISKDSISTLQQQKEALVISKRINDNKMKLAKLENTLEKQTRNADQTSADAQKSADINGRVGTCHCGQDSAQVL